MRILTRLFLRGLAAVLPVGLTIYIVYWLVTRGEGLLRSLLLLVMPEEYYVTGIGFVLALLAIILIGALNYSWVTRSFLELGTGLLERVPLVRAVYGMLKDMIRFFLHSEQDGFDQVVMVRVGAGEARALGFITRSDFSELPPGIGATDSVAVYVPMSYQLGGFMLVVPRGQIEVIDMSMDKALRFAVTAGMAYS